MWITTKIEACNNSFVRLGHCGEDTAAVFEQNLAQLGVAATDLTLLHAPTSTGGGSIVCEISIASPPRSGSAPIPPDQIHTRPPAPMLTPCLPTLPPPPCTDPP